MDYDTNQFKTEPYLKKIEKPWGYEIHWVPDNFPYMGKVFHVNAGARWSLQRHDQKKESWFLVHGEAKLVLDNEKGELVEIKMKQGVGYACAIGQRHRLIATTDCDIVEVSTPETGTTERLEDDYRRPNETEEMRKLPNRGWNEK